MAVRYRQELINIAGVYFKVEILDSNYIGSASDFYLKDFEIDWKGQQAERDNFILGSECVVMAQSTSTYDLNTLMDDIRESQEGRFQIAIYKKESVGANYLLHWIGMVLNDLSGGEDTAPVQHFDIVATDGLGALKGIEYRIDSSTPYGDLSAASHILNCLKAIPYNSFFGSSDVFLMEVVRVYESAMTNLTDTVLDRIQVPGTTFYDLDKNGNYEWKYCYEVLELLTVLFKSRLYLDNGIWRFYELYSLENEGEVNFFQYQYDGTKNTYGLVEWTNLINMSVSSDGETITKTSGGTAWNAGARSNDYLAANTDGWTETEVTSAISYHRMIGLSTLNNSTDFNHINFAIFLKNDGVIQIRESGTNRGDFGGYASGDTVRIERIGTTIYYKKNGTTFYTSTVSSTTVLYVDIVVFNENGDFYNTTASFYNQITLRQLLTGGFSGGNRLVGQRFEWLPALKEAKQTYIHDSSDNLLDVVINTSNGQQQIQAVIPSNGDETLMLSGSLTVNLVKTASPYTSVQTYVKLKLTIKHGPYYYVRAINNAVQNNDYSNAAWSLTLGYVEFILVQNTSQYGGSTIGYGFETLPLTNSGALEMNLEIDYVQDLQQNNIAANYTTIGTITGSYLEYIDGDAENERIYQALNDTSSFYSSIVEFPDAFCGDRINPMTPNNLKVWNGSAWVESTGTWERDGLSGTSTLLQLTLNEFLGGQRKFINKRQGEFVGKFSPLLAIGVSSEYYLPLGVRFSANDAVFSGDWYKIDEYNASGITVIDTPVAILSTLPPSSLASNPVNQTNPTGVLMTDGKVQIEDLSGRTTSVELAAANSFIKSPLSVGTSNKVDSAILVIESTSRGVLFPRMTEAQRNAISSPANGLYVHQTDGTVGLYFFTGSGWDKV